MLSISEFAGLLTRPALDHNFGFGEKFYGVASLAVKNAEEAFLPSAEREISHRGGDADINADIACRSFVAELPRRRAARGEKRGLISVRTTTQKFHGLVNRIGVNEA